MDGIRDPDFLTIPITSSNGQDIGEIFIPNTIAPGGIASVSFLMPNSDFTASVASAILDIEIYDAFGISITNFRSEIIICLRKTEKQSKVECLGFFNEKTKQWECEDKCFDKEGDFVYCGETCWFFFLFFFFLVFFFFKLFRSFDFFCSVIG